MRVHPRILRGLIKRMANTMLFRQDHRFEDEINGKLNDKHKLKTKKTEKHS